MTGAGILLQPGFAQRRTDLETSLANQGIPMGSEAYNSARNRLDDSQNQTL